MLNKIKSIGLKKSALKIIALLCATCAIHNAHATTAYQAELLDPGTNKVVTWSGLHEDTDYDAFADVADETFIKNLDLFATYSNVLDDDFTTQEITILNNACDCDSSCDSALCGRVAVGNFRFKDDTDYVNKVTFTGKSCAKNQVYLTKWSTGETVKCFNNATPDPLNKPFIVANDKCCYECEGACATAGSCREICINLAYSCKEDTVDVPMNDVVITITGSDKGDVTFADTGTHASVLVNTPDVTTPPTLDTDIISSSDIDTVGTDHYISTTATNALEVLSKFLKYNAITTAAHKRNIIHCGTNLQSNYTYVPGALVTLPKKMIDGASTPNDITPTYDATTNRYKLNGYTSGDITIDNGDAIAGYQGTISSKCANPRTYVLRVTGAAAFTGAIKLGDFDTAGTCDDCNCGDPQGVCGVTANGTVLLDHASATVDTTGAAAGKKPTVLRRVTCTS